MCLTGTVVAFWLLTQEVAGVNPFTTMTNISVTEFDEFSENIYFRSDQIRVVFLLSHNSIEVVAFNSPKSPIRSLSIVQKRHGHLGVL